jgi:O-glycosyl hydrolase
MPISHYLPRSLCNLVRLGTSALCLAIVSTVALRSPQVASAPNSEAVVVRVLVDQPRQIIDGFGTCLNWKDASSEWYRSLFLDDLRCSILRVDLTPRFARPFSDDLYNSPVPQEPAGPDPDGNHVRTYDGPSNYGRSFAGRKARIAVMGPDIERNLQLLNFEEPTWKAAGQLAQLGFAKKADLGDFKLVGSVWSPAPWLKVTSGNRIPEQPGPEYPKGGTPWPFIWSGCFSGGRFDASGTARSEFDDSAQGGQGPTSALVQFARGLAASVRGFQRTYQVQFYAVSLQNELNFETFYSSCSYPRSSDYVAVLKEVRREFDKYPDLKRILIMGPEDLLSDVYGLWQYGRSTNSTHKNLQYMAAVARDKDASRALSFFAIHGYAEDGLTSAGANPEQWHQWVDGWRERPAAGLPESVAGFRSYGKKSWMTETSGEAPAWLAPASGFPSEGALGLAMRIHQALTAGQESAWLYWQLSDGKDVSGETLTDRRLRGESAKYVAAKHFFATIRPGSRRLEAQVSGAHTILASAYLNANAGTLALVLINPDPTNQDIAVEVPSLPRGIHAFDVHTSTGQNHWLSSSATVERGRAAVTLPGYGIATLVGTGTVVANDKLETLPDIMPLSANGTDGQRRPGWGRLFAMSRHRVGLLLAACALVAICVLVRRRR